jgi:hypothetical protein
MNRASMNRASPETLFVDPLHHRALFAGDRPVANQRPRKAGFLSNPAKRRRPTFLSFHS